MMSNLKELKLDLEYLLGIPDGVFGDREVIYGDLAEAALGAITALEAKLSVAREGGAGDGPVAAAFGCRDDALGGCVRSAAHIHGTGCCFRMVRRGVLLLVHRGQAMTPARRVGRAEEWRK